MSFDLFGSRDSDTSSDESDESNESDESDESHDAPQLELDSLPIDGTFKELSHVNMAA